MAEIASGKSYPYGPTECQDGINFAIYINQPESVSLCIFEGENTSTPSAEYPLSRSVNKTGNVWHICVKNLKLPFIYAFRINGKLIIDPYAKAIHSPPKWNDPSNPRPYQPLAKAIHTENFDWQGVSNPNIHPKNLIIYEMHVRGFTQDPSSGVKNRGTYLGIIEKIPYLKELGVNAVELLPIFEFNEQEFSHKNPNTNEPLVNYFGYSHVNFFAPMNRYASRSENEAAVLEFKTMVRELHRNGIEVILDVVYNHTSEGNEHGPHYSFKGLDNNAYYMIDDQGYYYNFSGTGNTFNCNHPVALELILQSLRYWVTEMHVDGFRFDLATILKRDSNGAPFWNKAPVIEAISKDPILAKAKMIAEAWDCGGLYQVGGFYPGDRWSEWNGLYRDVTRKFIKGTSGYKQAFATALSGSLFQHQFCDGA
jgi:isoamylase/glycogen operon protein